MCEDCEPCELRPTAFFVAWSGVMTLAWQGFPPVLADLKRRIAETFPALPPEKPGSKWPKTTLGCLKEGARLTKDQLRTLTQLCKKLSGDIYMDYTQLGLSPLATTNPWFVPVDSLSVVLFQCRSLERVLSEHEVRFRGQMRNRHRPSKDECAVVDRVLVESSVENWALRGEGWWTRAPLPRRQLRSHFGREVETLTGGIGRLSECRGRGAARDVRMVRRLLPARHPARAIGPAVSGGE
jgi:hypothetical protein